MSEEDVQWLNREGQNYRAKSAEKASSVENGGGTEYHQQYQTILNLYHSGIPIYIIALQLDINEEDVHKIIQSTSNNTKPLSASPYSMSLLENKFDNDSLTPSLDNTVNTDIAIKNAQVRMWKALRSEPEINLSMEQTNEVLRAFAKSKVTLVTLNIDLVDSTELSITTREAIHHTSDFHARSGLSYHIVWWLHVKVRRRCSPRIFCCKY
jgi:hypothetical protein